MNSVLYRAYFRQFGGFEERRHGRTETIRAAATEDRTDLAVRRGGRGRRRQMDAQFYKSCCCPVIRDVTI